MAAALLLAVQTRGALFDITFSGDGTSGSGEISATDNGGGSYTATSGTFTVESGGAFTPIIYTLVPLPSGCSTVTLQAIQGTGGLNLTGDNQVFYPGDPYLTSIGLVFDTSLGVSGPAVNLWGNGSGSYTLYGAGGSMGAGFGVYGDATIDFAPVPEPSTMIAGLLLLAPCWGRHSALSPQPGFARNLQIRSSLNR